MAKQPTAASIAAGLSIPERLLLLCLEGEAPTFSHLIGPGRRNILAPAGKIILD